MLRCVMPVLLMFCTRITHHQQAAYSCRLDCNFLTHLICNMWDLSIGYPDWWLIIGCQSAWTACYKSNLMVP